MASKKEKLEALQKEIIALKDYSARLNNKINAIEEFFGITYNPNEGYGVTKSREEINKEIINQKGYKGMVVENLKLKDNKILKIAVEKDMGLDEVLKNNIFRNDRMFIPPKASQQSAQSLGINQNIGDK